MTSKHVLFFCVWLATSIFSEVMAESYKNCSSLLASDRVVVHNHAVQTMIGDEWSAENLGALLNFLLAKGTFDIPVESHGFVAAANVGDHHGGYGKNFWFRDLARVYQGLAAKVELLEELAALDSTHSSLLFKARKEVRQVAQALAKAASDHDFKQRLISNIENPALHLDEAVGYKAVPLIRRGVGPFAENRTPTKEEIAADEEWGHKQNDALAEFGQALLDAYDRNHLKAEVLEPLKTSLLLLPVYFLRVQYWAMWDVGAWEEKMALRTSSVGLVTGFLERFEDQYYGAVNGLYTQFKSEPLWGSVTRLELKSALDLANHVLEKQLSLSARQGVSEALLGDAYATRKEDTAILHLLWHPLRRLTLEQQLYIVNSMRILERPSGYIRYEKDWFLYGAAEASKNADRLGLSRSIAIPKGDEEFKVAHSEELKEIAKRHVDQSHHKDMDSVTELGGEGLEAQWTLPDAYLTHFYARVYMESGNRAFLEKALYHGRRMFGMVTSKEAIDSEGNKVEAFRIPEAYVPIRVIKDGRLEITYRVSPNSPLNWAVAETLRASVQLLKALSSDEKSLGH